MKLPARYRSLVSDLGLLYAAAIWGSTFIVVKDSLDNVDAVALVAYRFLLAAAILFVFLMLRHKQPFSNLRTGFTIGFFLWLLYISQTVGLKYTTAANSGLITGLFIVFVPIFDYAFFRRLPSVIKLFAIALALSGLWLLTGGLSGINRGDVMTLVAAATYAMHILLADRYVKGNIDPIILSFQQFFFVGVFSLIASLVFGLPLSVRSSGAMSSIVFLALFPTISGFVIQLVAQRYTPPVKVALIFTMEPVFAAIFAWTVGGEAFLPQRAIGGVMIVAGMILSELNLTGVRALVSQEQ
jgi:drug/metabolite transporter (DMT)-like permease